LKIEPVVIWTWYEVNLGLEAGTFFPSTTGYR